MFTKNFKLGLPQVSANQSCCTLTEGKHSYTKDASTASKAKDLAAKIYIQEVVCAVTLDEMSICKR